MLVIDLVNSLWLSYSLLIMKHFDSHRMNSNIHTVKVGVINISLVNPTELLPLILSHDL